MWWTEGIAYMEALREEGACTFRVRRQMCDEQGLEKEWVRGWRGRQWAGFQEVSDMIRCPLSHDPGFLGRSKAGTGGSGHKATAVVWAQGASGLDEQGGPSGVRTSQTAWGSGAFCLETHVAAHSHFSLRNAARGDSKTSSLKRFSLSPSYWGPRGKN